MFEELPFMLGFIVLSLIAGRVLLRALPSPYNTILFGFAIVGTILHEISHVVMCVITRTKVGKVSLLKKIPTQTNDRFAIGGEVNPKEEQRLSFIKAFLIGLAPTYICFWAFWVLWYQVRYAGLNELTIFLSILLMCSLVLGASPSLGDLRTIGSAFTRDVYHSVYQVMLIGLSIISVFVILYFSKIQVGHEFIIYLFIALGYGLFRYSFLGIHLLWQKTRVRNSHFDHTRIRARKLIRKTHKPMKPERLGIEEPHW